MAKENLFLCMGSACHQLGVYEVLPRLQALIQEYQLEEIITLKGSFCLETCSHGITMKFRDQHFMNISPQNIEEKFVQEILPAIQTVECVMSQSNDR
ncbi:MAG TPA: (2Fe-2S) ferredoxin domain-containing protein [Microcoleaceae cyanobacterium]|jgi:NADH:ubiquinone oxidoreductase subunit E